MATAALGHNILSIRNYGTDGKASYQHMTNYFPEDEHVRCHRSCCFPACWRVRQTPKMFAVVTNWRWLAYRITQRKISPSWYNRTMPSASTAAAKTAAATFSKWNKPVTWLVYSDRCVHHLTISGRFWPSQRRSTTSGTSAGRKCIIARPLSEALWPAHIHRAMNY